MLFFFPALLSVDLKDNTHVDSDKRINFALPKDFKLWI